LGANLADGAKALHVSIAIAIEATAAKKRIVIKGKQVGEQSVLSMEMLLI
jgi:glycine betaine/choline ABC-type transport system substrate-binding protein